MTSAADDFIDTCRWPTLEAGPILFSALHMVQIWRYLLCIIWDVSKKHQYSPLFMRRTFEKNNK